MLKEHLNKKVFDVDCELEPIRKGFGTGLLEAGKHNDNVVALCADLTESTQMHHFRKEFPERFIEIGVAEQNLVTVASGLSAVGKIPFCSSYAMFSPGRNWEQIRTTITYNNTKVAIVGSHAGISVGPDGGTHQAIEDIALMRVLPNMTVVVPCDSIEAHKATLAIADKKIGPTYLRLQREKTGLITTTETPFKIGEAYIMYESDNAYPEKQLLIIGCGGVLVEALKAANKLTQKGWSVMVVNMHTVKPLDTKLLARLTQKYLRVVVVEEHQVAGGLGSAVAEYLVEYNPVPMRFVGVRNKYGQSGTQDELLSHYGLDAEAIIETAHSF